MKDLAAEPAHFSHLSLPFFGVEILETYAHALQKPFQLEQTPLVNLHVAFFLKQGALPTLILQSQDPVAELEGAECRYLLERALG